jgi:hypothetical protein
MDVVMSNLVPAVELIYRELARPKAAGPPPASPKAEAKVELSRDDVNRILQGRRGARETELEHIILNAMVYGLTSGELDQIRVALTIQIAQAMQNNGRRDDPNSRFIAQVIGLRETPFGLIDLCFIEDLLRAASQNIMRCKQHRPPKCECWSAQRAILWQAQNLHGEKSPEGWAALRIYEALEGLELVSPPPVETS